MIVIVSNRSQQKPVLELDLEGNILNRYESVSEVSKKKGFAHASIIYRIRTGCVRGGIMFAFENPEDNKPNGNNWCYIPKKPKDAKQALDASKYKIVKYEVRNLRECITPCPFKEHPRPMVGSAGCMECSSFRGRDNKSHLVACNKHYI